jgi:energy-coupling factor transporter ATP-binding protein EcfA2
MYGVRSFIHHRNPENLIHPDTRAILIALNAVIEAEEPLIVPLLGKPGTGKTHLLEYWASLSRQRAQGNTVSHRIIYAEVDHTEKATLGKGVYTTPAACVTFSSIMYGLAELSRRVDSPNCIPKWYREERPLYTDREFVWLFDQVCLEARRLRVRGIAIDNAHRLDVPSLKALMRFRKRLDGRVGLVLAAQLAKNEKLDEPLGALFERAQIDSAECDQVIELRPLSETVFYQNVVGEVFKDLDADFQQGLEQHTTFIATSLWELTAGDWKSITSRVRHFNRLLPPRGGGPRIITRSIIEQVLGRKLPE